MATASSRPRATSRCRRAALAAASSSPTSTSSAGAAEVLLVVGSSLTVFSGYRFVLRAAERGQRIAIVNLGETRGDPHAHVRVDARAGEVLPALARAL